MRILTSYNTYYMKLGEKRKKSVGSGAPRKRKIHKTPIMGSLKNEIRSPHSSTVNTKKQEGKRLHNTSNKKSVARFFKMLERA